MNTKFLLQNNRARRTSRRVEVAVDVDEPEDSRTRPTCLATEPRNASQQCCHVKLAIIFVTWVHDDVLEPGHYVMSRSRYPHVCEKTCEEISSRCVERTSVVGRSTVASAKS